MIMLDKYAKVIEWATKTYPDCDIFGSLSPNQLHSKLWLIEKLKRIPQLQGPWYTPNSVDYEGNTIEIVGSWYGFPLIEMLQKEFMIRRIDCWDIDFEARQIAEQYNNIFGVTNVNIFGKDYFAHERDGSQAHLLINTSSEHMMETFADLTERYGKPRKGLDPVRNFYVKDPLIVIQSNNMHHIDEHINCVDSEEELIDKHKIRKVLYSGSQNIIEWHDTKIEESKYKRFMVIGKL